MNTTRHLLPSKAAAFFSALALLAGLCAAPALHATEYYWNTMDSGHYWNTNISDWKTTGGTSATAFVNGDIFHSNDKAVSTELSTSTFGSGSDVTLVLDGGDKDQISVKATGSNVATVSTLISLGGTIAAAQQNGATDFLRVNTFIATSGITYLNASSNENTRTLQVSIGVLSGAGTFEISPNSGTSRIVNLGIDDATAFTGAFDFTLGTVHFTADLVSSGSLILSDSVKLSSFGKSLTFSSVTIAGTALAAGTYTFQELQGYGANIASGASGTITVAPIPEVSTFASIAGAVLLAFAAWRRRRA